MLPKEDGSPTPKWRIADLYLADYDAAVAALSSPEDQSLAHDSVTSAIGGIDFLFSDIVAATASSGA